jgi:hypothetical protein
MDSRATRSLGLITIAAVLYWLAVILLMHLLEPEFSPMKVPMSAYVLGAFGGWMTTSFFALSTALLAAGCGLAASLPRSIVGWAALFLFIVAASGVVLAGLFPMSFPDGSNASSAHLHALGGLIAFPAMALGPFLSSLTFRRYAHWRRVSELSLTLSAGIVAVFFFGRFLRVPHGFGGLVQRLFFAFLIPWLIVVGIHLVRARRERN